MNLLIWVCLAQVAWPSTFAMYYTKLKEVFQPPKISELRNNSYFGYSITYDEFNKKLVISAPRESDIGEVYDCDINSRSCSPIDHHDKIERVLPSNYTHDYWFGATVKAGRDFVMMCAPRSMEHTRMRIIKKEKKDIEQGYTAYVTRGKCYTHAKGVLAKRRSIDEDKRLADSPSPMEATMDSFGWSIDVSSKNNVLVGGPGMFHGRAMIYGRIDQTPDFIRKSSNTPEFNFGYAVAFGAFIHDTLSYAVSSPYGNKGFGEVLFYKSKITYILKLTKTADTELVGTMFGAVLCAATLLGERTDLLVGAPTYATKNTYNLGAVYVYLAVTHGQSPKFKRRIAGQESGSLFGSAIINVGDLNGDKKDEIVIGAPFEKNGQGVVYLYSGADLISELTEKTLKWLQRIEPEKRYGESFGMSLTPLLDYDGNGCKELAIGSPYTNTVVLLRCMAAVIVKTSVTFPKLQGRSSTGKTNFEFEVCLSVEYPRLPEKIKGLITTTVEMDHSYAKLSGTDRTGRFSFDTSLADKKPKYCKKVPFILPPDGKYDTEISYTISSELPDDPKILPDFDSSRVILSDRSNLILRDSLWAAECAGDICVPILDFKPAISFLHDDHQYIIGSSITETIDITVTNNGEVAYDSCVRVHIVGASVLQPPAGCVYEDSTDGDRLRCEPSKPIPNSQNWNTGQIVLEMTHLTNLNQEITVNMLLFNRCKDVSTKNNSISVPVKADPIGIVAKGETDIGAIVNMTEEEIKINGKDMAHIYTIMNYGPTNWVELPVEVTLHKYPYIEYEDIPVTATFSTFGKNVNCSIVSQNKESMTCLCTIESLMKSIESAQIYIAMHIVPGKLDEFLEDDKNVTILSTVSLQFGDNNYKAESTITTITLQEATVPIDTIIIAVVVALCILIIIALILYRVGFLRRKKREELLKLRKDIKRQTIKRQSTMPSQAPQAEDQRNILEGMQEEHEHDQAPSQI